MAIQNPDIRLNEWLSEMYEDDYYPNFLVDKCKAVFETVCGRIERERPENLDALYAITHAATEQINDLQDEFGENGSEIETAARDCLGTTMHALAKAYGFDDADIEELIATRDW